MNNYLAYTSYRCVPADGKEVTIPLRDDITIPRSLLQALLTDLRDFSIVKADTPWQSALEFQIGETTYTVERDHATGSLNFAPASADIYVDISAKLGATITLASHGQHLITPNSQISFNPEVIAALNAGGDQNPEIAEIEARLAAQRKADEAQLKITDLESKLPEFDTKMADVDALVKKQAQLQQLLGKYSYVLKPDIKTDEVKYKQEIENIRHEYLQKVLHEQPHQAQADTDDSAMPFFPKDGLQGKVVLFYMGITALVALATWLITGQIVWMLFGGLLCLLQLLNLVAINKVPAAIAWTMRRQMGEDASSPPDTERVEVKSQQRLSWLEKFFIDKAWVMALQVEIQNLNKTMQDKLGGEQASAISEAKQKLIAEIAEYKSHIDAMQGKEIPPEEYLELRRKLERLKAEASGAKSGTNMISSLTAGKYTAAMLDGEKLSLADPTGTMVGYDQLATDIQLLLLAVTQILTWQNAAQMPLVLADIMSKLAVDAKDAFAKLLQQARAQGQVLTINVTE